MQVCGYTICGLAAFAMCLDSVLGTTVTLACGMLSRAMLAASNSAMWIAAPEMYLPFADSSWKVW